MRIKNWAMPLVFGGALLFAGIIATMFIGVVYKDDRCTI